MKKKDIILVTSVKALDGYKLLVCFNTQEKKMFDFSKYLEWNVFKKLKDPELFNKVTTNGETVIWDDQTDIAPERLYSDGVLLS